MIKRLKWNVDYKVWLLDWPVVIQHSSGSESSCQFLVAKPGFDPRGKICNRVPYPQQDCTYEWELVEKPRDIHESYRDGLRKSARRLIFGQTMACEHCFEVTQDYAHQHGGQYHEFDDAINA